MSELIHQLHISLTGKEAISEYCPGSIWQSLAREMRNMRNKLPVAIFSSREMHVIRAKFNNNNHNNYFKIFKKGKQ